MNRGLLLSVLSCGLLAAAAGCGDDVIGTGGSGGSSTTTTGTGTTSTGMSTTKSTTTGTGSTTSTGSMAANCDDYCAAIDANCGDPFAQYSMGACAEICPVFMQGNAGDTSMNTLECRAYHTAAAASMTDPHCMHAGPLGGGPDAGNGCGMQRCSSFCSIAIAVCDGNDAQWPTEADCMTDCMTIPDNVDYSTLETGGNTLACRMYHLNVAAGAKNMGDMAGKATHCGHIPVDSMPCGG